MVGRGGGVSKNPIWLHCTYWRGVCVCVHKILQNKRNSYKGISVGSKPSKSFSIEASKNYDATSRWRITTSFCRRSRMLREATRKGRNFTWNPQHGNSRWDFFSLQNDTLLMMSGNVRHFSTKFPATLRKLIKKKDAKSCDVTWKISIYIGPKTIQ